MVSAGDVFKAEAPPYHRWVALTSPDENGEIVIVNLTSKEGPEDDQGCILQPVDYPQFIKHATAVRYSGARQGSATALEESSNFSKKESLPRQTIEKIQRRAIESDFFKKRFKKYVEAELT